MSRIAGHDLMLPKHVQTATIEMFNGGQGLADSASCSSHRIVSSTSLGRNSSQRRLSMAAKSKFTFPAPPLVWRPSGTQMVGRDRLAGTS